MARATMPFMPPFFDTESSIFTSSNVCPLYARSDSDSETDPEEDFLYVPRRSLRIELRRAGAKNNVVHTNML